MGSKIGSGLGILEELPLAIQVFIHIESVKEIIWCAASYSQSNDNISK